MPSLATTDIAGGPAHERAPQANDRTQVQLIDISRASFCSATDPNNATYVELPVEHPGRERGQCGLLKPHMYGAKQAAEGRRGEYAGTLCNMGFTVGNVTTVPIIAYFRSTLLATSCGCE